MIVLYPSQSKFFRTPDTHEVLHRGDTEYQGLRIEADDLHILCLYLLPGKATKIRIAKILDDELLRNAHIIMGELTLNPRVHDDKQRLDQLCHTQYKMHLKEETRNHNHIDHILVHERIHSRVYTTSFYNFVSDHKSIVARVAEIGNDLTDEAKQTIHSVDTADIVHDADFNIAH